MRRATWAGLRRAATAGAAGVLAALAASTVAAQSRGAPAQPPAGVPATAASESPAEAETIAEALRAVIRAQLEAFAADDAERAFSFASPGIRQQFGRAEVFMRMVRQSYAVLLSPRETQFLEPARIEGELVQPLRVTDREGTVSIALYRMELQADGTWKIGGCVLAPSVLKSI